MNTTATETTKQINGSDIKPGMTVLRRVPGMGTVWVQVHSAARKGDEVTVVGYCGWHITYTTHATAGVIQRIGA